MADIKLDGPLLKTPLSHVGVAAGWNLYVGGICSKIQIDLMECYEAYGYKKAMQYCRGHLDDYYECRLRRKQIKRRDAMEYERKKQYRQGLIQERYLPPPPRDAY